MVEEPSAALFIPAQPSPVGAGVVELSGRLPSGGKPSVDQLSREAIDAMPGGYFSIYVAHRRPHLDQRAAHVEGDGPDWRLRLNSGEVLCQWTLNRERRHPCRRRAVGATRRQGCRRSRCFMTRYPHRRAGTAACAGAAMADHSFRRRSLACLVAERWSSSIASPIR